MNFTEYYQKNAKHSDRGTTHSYICWFYNGEFTHRKEEHLWIVEIGVETGDSLELFAGWFPNGKIWGVDVNDRGYWFQHPNINFIHADGFSNDAADRFADGSLDYVIDDGPHTLESQLKAVSLWMPRLKPGGRLVIEDVQDLELARAEFDKLGLPYSIFDLRRNKGRYDDVIFCLTKEPS
jgi:hypothetical protein